VQRYDFFFELQDICTFFLVTKEKNRIFAPLFKT